MTPIKSQDHLDNMAHKGTPLRPSAHALLAAAVIESDLSMQDGWDGQPWDVSYRRHIARMIDAAMTMAAPPTAEGVLIDSGILDVNSDRVR